MDLKIHEKFLKLWNKYFGDSELPITFYYSNETGDTEPVKRSLSHRCIMADLDMVRKGKERVSIRPYADFRYTGHNTRESPSRKKY